MTTSLTLDDLGYFAVPNEIPEADLLLRIQAHYVDGTSESTALDNPGDDDVQYAVSQFYEKDHSDRERRMTPDEEDTYDDWFTTGPGESGCGCRAACFCYDVPEETLDEQVGYLLECTSGGVLVT